MKPVFSLSCLVVLGFVYGCGKTQEVVTPPVAASQPTQFNCVQEDGQWLTYAYQGNYTAPEPMFNWQTTEFGEDFTPEKRCYHVSTRLNQAVMGNNGLLANLVLKEGEHNRLKVICWQNRDEGCDGDNLLFTLSEKNQVNPTAVMVKMSNYAQEQAGNTVYEKWSRSGDRSFVRTGGTEVTGSVYDDGKSNFVRMRNRVVQKWIRWSLTVSPLLLFVALEAYIRFSIGNVHERLVKSAVRINAPETGSGVIFKREGNEYWVVTAAHSVDGKAEDGTELAVQTSVMVTADGQIWTIQPNQKSFIPDTDLAVLRFESDRDYPVVKLGKSEELQRGQEIIVVGSPMTTPERPNREVLTTEGKVIGFGQQVLGYGFSYDAVTQPGMSGAGVFDQKGQLVGIHGQGINQNGGKLSGGMPITLLDRLPPKNVVLEPAETSTEKPAQEWFKEGLALINLGRYEEAINSFDNAIELNPDYHKAWYNRGSALRYLERDKEALTSYDKAVEIKPDDYKAWSHRGNTLDVLGREVEAIVSFDKALQINPDFHYALNNRGFVYEQMREYEKALSDYEQVLAIDPDDTIARNNRERVAGKLGL